MRRDEFTMEDQQEIEDFLSGMSFGFLGTADEEGIPRVTPLNYAYVNGAFYFHGDRMGKNGPSAPDARRVLYHRR